MIEQDIFPFQEISIGSDKKQNYIVILLLILSIVAVPTAVYFAKSALKTNRIIKKEEN